MIGAVSDMNLIIATRVLFGGGSAILTGDTGFPDSGAQGKHSAGLGRHLAHQRPANFSTIQPSDLVLP